MTRVATLAVIVIVGLLLGAAAVEEQRPFVLVALGAAFVATWWSTRRDRPGPPAWALVVGACLLVTMSLAWTGVDLPAAARDGSTCTDPAAPFAAYRVVGAVLVLTAVALVLRLLRGTAGAVGIRRETNSALAVALGALVAVGAVAVVIGPALAEPFFGPLPIRMGDPAALAPALLFAIANAAMEETVYRGVLFRSLLRWSGPVLALAVQAAAFGLAHGVGSDFAGSPLPVMAATALGGLAFGAVALRTGSLLMPIAVHAALDIPIYYANACLQVSG